MENTFINQNSNDQFSSLRGLDLQNLLVETNSYLLEYRHTLNLPNEITFGIEIEYEGVSKSTVDNYIETNLNDWNSIRDASLHFGGEITSPIMRDEIKYWNEIKKICKYLTERKADTLHNAGGHIHIGGNALNDNVESWKRFLKLYTAYENVLFRFAYGDKISGRKDLFKYAVPISDFLYSKMPNIKKSNTMEEIIESVHTKDRYVALNLNNISLLKSKYKMSKYTIEFRSPNATTNEVIWQNNINTFSKMILSSKNNLINEEFLDFKLENEYLLFSQNEYLYNEVNLKNVLEFVDLVFDNNKDKIYFLRQYLKSFQDNYGIKKAVSAKKFVK